jgi:AraC-like DNA-binding protein
MAFTMVAVNRAQAGANAWFAALADVCRELASVPDPTWLPRARSEAVKRAMDFTLEHLDETPGVKQVAAAAFVSERTLARRFTDELNMSWLQFLHRARMIRATELLLDPEANITTVGLAVGFASTSAFIHAFKAFSGRTPLQYRRQHLPGR